MASFKISPGKMATSVEGARKINDILPRSIGKAAQDLLNNERFAKLYSKLVPDAEKRILEDLLFGGQGRGQVYRDLDARHEPQTDFWWSCILPFGFPPSYVEDAVIPVESIDSIHHQRKNRKRHDPGYVEIDSLTINFYEDRKGKTHDFLLKWKDLVEKDGYYGRPSDYKRDIILTLHDAKGNPVIIAICKKAWPSTISAINLQSEGSGRVRPEVTFPISTVEWEIPGRQSYLEKLGIEGTDIFDIETAGGKKIVNPVEEGLNYILKNVL